MGELKEEMERKEEARPILSAERAILAADPPRGSRNIRHSANAAIKIGFLPPSLPRSLPSLSPFLTFESTSSFSPFFNAFKALSPFSFSSGCCYSVDPHFSCKNFQSHHSRQDLFCRRQKGKLVEEEPNSRCFLGLSFPPSFCQSASSQTISGSFIPFYLLFFYECLQ